MRYATGRMSWRLDLDRDIGIYNCFVRAGVQPLSNLIPHASSIPISTGGTITEIEGCLTNHSHSGG